jgi:hypothetical protein
MYIPGLFLVLDEVDGRRIYFVSFALTTGDMCSKRSCCGYTTVAEYYYSSTDS